jgi:hypothetical protein
MTDFTLYTCGQNYHQSEEINPISRKSIEEAGANTTPRIGNLEGVNNMQRALMNFFTSRRLLTNSILIGELRITPCMRSPFIQTKIFIDYANYPDTNVTKLVELLKSIENEIKDLLKGIASVHRLSRQHGFLRISQYCLSSKPALFHENQYKQWLSYAKEIVALIILFEILSYFYENDVSDTKQSCYHISSHLHLLIKTMTFITIKTIKTIKTFQPIKTIIYNMSFMTRSNSNTDSRFQFSPIRLVFSYGLLKNFLIYRYYLSVQKIISQSYLLYNCKNKDTTTNSPIGIRRILFDDLLSFEIIIMTSNIYFYRSKSFLANFGRSNSSSLTAINKNTNSRGYGRCPLSVRQIGLSMSLPLLSSLRPLLVKRFVGSSKSTQLVVDATKQIATNKSSSNVGANAGSESSPSSTSLPPHVTIPTTEIVSEYTSQNDAETASRYTPCSPSKPSPHPGHQALKDSNAKEYRDYQNRQNFENAAEQKNPPASVQSYTPSPTHHNEGTMSPVSTPQDVLKKVIGNPTDNLSQKNKDAYGAIMGYGIRPNKSSAHTTTSNPTDTSSVPTSATPANTVSDVASVADFTSDIIAESSETPLISIPENLSDAAPIATNAPVPPPLPPKPLVRPSPRSDSPINFSQEISANHQRRIDQGTTEAAIRDLDARLERERDFSGAIAHYKLLEDPTNYEIHRQNLYKEHPFLEKLVDDFANVRRSHRDIDETLKNLSQHKRTLANIILLYEYHLIQNEPIAGEQISPTLRDIIKQLAPSKKPITAHLYVSELSRDQQDIKYTIMIYSETNHSSKELLSGEQKHPLIGYKSADGKYFISTGYMTSQFYGNEELSTDQPFQEPRKQKKIQYFHQFDNPRAIPIEELSPLPDLNFRIKGDVYVSQSDIVDKLNKFRKAATTVEFADHPGYGTDELTSILANYRKQQLGLAKRWYKLYNDVHNIEAKKIMVSNLEKNKNSNLLAYKLFIDLKNTC